MESHKNILSHQELSYEEFDAELASLDGRTMLTGPVKKSWISDMVYLDDIVLQVLQEGGPNAYEGSGIADHVTIAVGLPAPTWVRANGVSLDSSRLLLVRGNNPLDSHSRDVCRYAGITVSVEQFIKAVECFDPSQTERLMFGPINVGIPPMKWQILVDLVNRMLTAAAGDVVQNRTAQRALSEELINTFVSIAASSPRDPKAMGRPQIPRQPILVRIREYLGSELHVPYSITAMAGYVGVPVRTLHYLVYEQFGVSPKQLLTFHQLRDIRTALKQAEPDEKVTSILSRNGVWEWGRFAQRYFALYGEKPSMTLGHKPCCRSSLRQSLARHYTKIETPQS